MWYRLMFASHIPTTRTNKTHTIVNQKFRNHVSKWIRTNESYINVNQKFTNRWQDRLSSRIYYDA
ncbi:hypothetical protein MtrunA17_Chr4g0018321 [Medicago truncatula]|uniref:Uncharacterized protein n=1 Tax=Medicago truncatula TaxID=3880 RepID=A0A396I6E4_MEDTR|nr:hypothetical protein MtrunA17_Chr4g0018321 [Medicago truncatula]